MCFVSKPLFSICDDHFDRKYLENLYDSLDIDFGYTHYIWRNDPLHPMFKRENLITTVVQGNKIETYSSAYCYYAKVKCVRLGRPDLAQKIVYSDDPFKYSFVPWEDFLEHVHEWTQAQVDTAFKASWLKFTQNEDFGRYLIETGRCYIVFPQKVPWGTHDRSNKFGDDKPNITGKIMMVIREELRRRRSRGDEGGCPSVNGSMYSMSLEFC